MHKQKAWALARDDVTAAAQVRCARGTDGMLISTGDQQRIADAIATAERATSGEIVAVVAEASGSYLAASFMWAGIAALAVPLPLIHWTWWPIQTIYLVQIAVFAALALLFNYRPLRLALTPRRTKHRLAHRRAVEQFLAQNLHTTPGRTGVLIFVSVAERYAEIVADAEINRHVPVETWTGIVNDLTSHIADGQASTGFLRAIQTVGTLLADHFPPGTHHRDTLPNHLILLPAD
jgi:putative membrane protein